MPSKRKKKTPPTPSSPSSSEVASSSSGIEFEPVATRKKGPRQKTKKKTRTEEEPPEKKLSDMNQLLEMDDESDSESLLQSPSEAPSPRTPQSLAEAARLVQQSSNAQEAQPKPSGGMSYKARRRTAYDNAKKQAKTPDTAEREKQSQEETIISHLSQRSNLDPTPTKEEKFQLDSPVKERDYFEIIRLSKASAQFARSKLAENTSSQALSSPQKSMNQSQSLKDKMTSRIEGRAVDELNLLLGTNDFIERPDAESQPFMISPAQLQELEASGADASQFQPIIERRKRGRPRIKDKISHAMDLETKVLASGGAESTFNKPLSLLAPSQQPAQPQQRPPEMISLPVSEDVLFSKRNQLYQSLLGLFGSSTPPSKRKEHWQIVRKPEALLPENRGKIEEWGIKYQDNPNLTHLFRECQLRDQLKARMGQIVRLEQQKEINDFVIEQRRIEQDSHLEKKRVDSYLGRYGAWLQRKAQEEDNFEPNLENLVATFYEKGKQPATPRKVANRIRYGQAKAQMKQVYQKHQDEKQENSILQVERNLVYSDLVVDLEDLEGKSKRHKKLPEGITPEPAPLVLSQDSNLADFQVSKNTERVAEKDCSFITSSAKRARSRQMDRRVGRKRRNPNNPSNPGPGIRKPRQGADYDSYIPGIQIRARGTQPGTKRGPYKRRNRIIKEKVVVEPPKRDTPSLDQLLVSDEDEQES